MSKWMKVWYNFLRKEFNATAFRNQKSLKVRKYEHVEIQKEFKKLDDIRRQQRRGLLAERKKLLENQLNKTRLIDSKAQQDTSHSGQISQIQTEIQAITKSIEEEKEALKDIDSKLEDTESEMILLKGVRKLGVMNQIVHLRHLQMHNKGFTLHAQTMKAIQNVHYLVDHNLPVPKFTLLEVFPQIFSSQIGELDESVRRLLEERREQLQTNSTPLYRFFQMDTKIDPTNVIDVLKGEESQLITNLNNQMSKILSEHSHIFNKIANGETRFRSLRHFVYECIDVDQESEFTHEEWRAKQAAGQVIKIRDDFLQWKKGFWVKVHQYQYRTRWPQYLNDKPDLVQLYKDYWEKIRSVIVPLETLAPDNSPGPNLLQLKIRAALEEETKRRKLLAVGGKMDRTVNTVEAYKMFTNCLAELQEQQLLESADQQLIVRINKKPEGGSLLGQAKDNRISADDLAKVLLLNENNPQKYNLQFFSRFFGVGENTLRSSLDLISLMYQKEQSVKFLKFRYG